MGPVLVSYLRTVGEAGAAAWEAVVGSVGSVGPGGTDDNCVPWPGEEGLARGQDKELWPPLIFAMSPNWMEEGFVRGFGVSQGRAQVFIGGKNDLCGRASLLFNGG